MKLSMVHQRPIMALLLGASLMLGSAAVLTPMPAWAQTVPERTISTQGHGEVRIKPDSLMVNVMVESRDDSLADARQDNNRKMQAIINALKGLDIPNMKLETQSVQVHPIQGEMQRDRLPRTVGYQVNNGLNVTVTRVSSDMLGEYASRIVDTALNAGANNVHGMNFFLDDMTPSRMQALKLAVEDARRNAEAMAQAAGVTLSGVYSLEGYPQFGGPRPPMPMYAMRASGMVAEAAQMPVEVGETIITSDVTARFKF